MLRPFLLLWLVIVASGYSGAMYLMVDTLHASKLEAEREHRARLDPKADESGRTEIDDRVLESVQIGDQVPVEAGIYIDRVKALSMPETYWTVDFYLWFRWWNGDIHPGDNFQVIDGEILSRELKASFVEDQAHYELYRVVANITKFFNVSRFPRTTSWRCASRVPNTKSAKCSL